MPRRSNRRQLPSCSCLVVAFRTFPEPADLGQGCASPECLVKGLDSITLHQFLQAIGGPDGIGDEVTGAAEDRADFRTIARRFRRRRSSRPPV
jgi:hypothetical protein